MSLSDSRLALALTQLAAQGFVAAPRNGSARCFDGHLNCQAGPVPVRVEVTDWDFIDYPVIRLLDRPAFLSGVVPHLSSSGVLCYFQEGAVILDRYRPDHALLQCLERARNELDRLARSPTYREGEFEAEFSASWILGQEPRAITLMLGDLDPQADFATCFEVGDTDERWLLVASRVDDVRRFCEAAGWTISDNRYAHCHILRSTYLPTLPVKLPTSVGEMFAWLRTWDKSVYMALQDRLVERSYLTAGAALFIIETPAGSFGFQFKLELFKRTAYRLKPRLYRQFLHAKGSAQSIMRLNAMMVSVDYIHSRNLQHASLKGRRITLIGCGAIGGYVAQALARLGAGTGAGRLLLVDPDTLTADNLGRHALGVESLLRGKAKAMSDSLKRQFPMSVVDHAPRRADPRIDFDADIVINATGEEAVGLMLNDHHQRLSRRGRPPLIHAWIAGNGEAVQALCVDDSKFGCFRCLRQTDDARTVRFRILKDEPITRVRGCRAFRPYAVSAPMAAAALAIDLVIAWLEGNPSPRFRTRVVESAAVQRVKNQDISSLESCPACRT